MSVVVITGSCGLVGSEAVAHFTAQGFDVVGIDNDMRREFFGPAASTGRVRAMLERDPRYRHHDIDVRDRGAVDRLVARYGRDVVLVIHAAGQPSHDWAARDPHRDFSVNATGTLVLLECVRQWCPHAAFIFMSTNKVYGDGPNRLPLVEMATRFEVDRDHPAHAGIDERMPVDQSTHSLFGVSKLAADLLVQEYGRCFGLKTVCFRAGCVSGPNHAGAVLHGFLSYLLQCTCAGSPYTVFGYKGKQVRDNLHSADLVRAFDAFFREPGVGEVYNIGGGRASTCSVIEAIALCEGAAGRPLRHTYQEQPRVGDHAWYVSDVARFQTHYPAWRPQFDVPSLIEDMYERNAARWTAVGAP